MPLRSLSNFIGYREPGPASYKENIPKTFRNILKAGRATSAAFSKDGLYLAVHLEDNSLSMYSTQTLVAALQVPRTKVCDEQEPLSLTLFVEADVTCYSVGYDLLSLARSRERTGTSCDDPERPPQTDTTMETGLPSSDRVQDPDLQPQSCTSSNNAVEVIHLRLVPTPPVKKGPPGGTGTTRRAVAVAMAREHFPCPALPTGITLWQPRRDNDADSEGVKRPPVAFLLAVSSRHSGNLNRHAGLQAKSVAPPESLDRSARGVVEIWSVMAANGLTAAAPNEASIF